jgi:hypothetical protein
MPDRTLPTHLCILYTDDPFVHSYCPGDHSAECKTCTRMGKGVPAPPGTKPSGAQEGWTRSGSTVEINDDGEDPGD